MFKIIWKINDKNNSTKNIQNNFDKIIQNIMFKIIWKINVQNNSTNKCSK